MADTVQQIKDRLSINDVVTQYVKLDRAGSTWRARCPFHAEKTPSFYVSPERGTYHCFGCGVGGDVFSFVQAVEGLDFKGALKLLAEKAGVQIEYHGRKEDVDARDRLFGLLEAATIFFQGKLGDEAREYLKTRGLEAETIKDFRLGLVGDEWSLLSDHLRGKKYTERELLDAGVAKKNERGGLTDKFRNRIMFPISDSAGRVIGFSGRTFGEKASPEAPKYLNSPETPLFQKSRILYGFDRAKQSIRKHNFAVLVEGQMDLLMSHQAGWGNTVAVSGTAFTAQHAALVKRMTENLVIALDADEAGIKAAGRAARAALAAGLNVKVAALPTGSDPADLILKEGPEAWKKAIREAKDIITFLLDVLEERTPQKDKFRRLVEAAVLPFLADVQSPIAREQYLNEIAERLGVSAKAVTDALRKVPDSPLPSPPAAAPAAKSKTGVDRPKLAYSMFAWQSLMEKPDLDVKAFGKELREAIGEEVFSALEQLPDGEKETLRFLAERQYGKSSNLKREKEMLLAVLLRDRLRREMQETSAKLAKAEQEGDKEEERRLEVLWRSLSAQLATL